MSFSWPILPSPRSSPGQKFGVIRNDPNHPHTGLDMGRRGNKVLASASGSVKAAYDAGSGKGNVVYIDHGNGYETRYMHLDRFTVKKGDTVYVGNQIGVVGLTGLPKPWPHLHFEILSGGVYVDPASLLPASGNVGGNFECAANYPPDAPAAPSGSVWPVAGTKDFRVATGMDSRAIGAERNNGAKTHAGIDLFAKYGYTIVSIADGQITSFYWFTSPNVFALFVDYGSFAVNYGEVDPNSLLAWGLKTPKYKEGERTSMMTSSSPGASQHTIIASSGSKVKAGQPIAIVGRMNRSSMLHFECYSSGISANKQWKPFRSAAPSGLLNPTALLIEIATGKRVVTVEPTSVVACR